MSMSCSVAGARRRRWGGDTESSWMSGRYRLKSNAPHGREQRSSPAAINRRINLLLQDVATVLHRSDRLGVWRGFGVGDGVTEADR